MARRVNPLVQRAELSRRIRSVRPADWDTFLQLWSAFNQIYGTGKQPEEDRLQGCLREYLAEKEAEAVVVECQDAIDRLIAIPPGDVRLEERDPGFRRRSASHAARAQDRTAPALERLTAVAGILYQVRCNLAHGDKDPINQRDQMLVTNSNHVMMTLLPYLENALERADR